MVGTHTMPGKSFSPSEHEIKIQGILNGNVESYVRWAEIHRFKGYSGIAYI